MRIAYNNGTAKYSVSMVTKICLCSNTKHYWLWTLSTTLNQTIQYYDKMVSMITIGPPRPSISEYPQIAEHIRQAIYEVEHEIKTPVQAINDAAFKSAKVLGG